MNVKDLFKKECSFIASANSVRNYPFTNNLDEIAFWGRSNVGKSSLINAIVSRKALARVSNTPGRTQLLNFFNLGDKIVIVDLPGYGYAKVSKTERVKWEKFIAEYLGNRAQLRRVFLLIDGKVGFKENDLEVLEFLNAIPVPHQIVLTKCDKSKEVNKIVEKAKEYTAFMPALHPEILITSSTKKNGIDEIRKSIFDIINIEEGK